MKQQILIQTSYQCPICKQRYLEKEKAENCFSKCKKSYFEYVKLTMKFNFVSCEYKIIINEDYDYFPNGKEEFEKRLNEVDIFYNYQIVEFTTRCKTRSEILETRKRLMQFFIDWCMKRINHVKERMEIKQDGELSKVMR